MQHRRTAAFLPQKVRQDPPKPLSLIGTTLEWIQGLFTENRFDERHVPLCLFILNRGPLSHYSDK